MIPILADGIDIPVVLGLGLGVLIPLMAFEVFAEAYVLRFFWKVPFGDLCRFTFAANCWSLGAGIPTKVANSFLYGALLPADIPGFLKGYPFVIGLGSLIYFVVTVFVEGWFARRWRRVNEYAFTGADLWRGIVLANIATYAVLAPIHYYATKPANYAQEVLSHTRWTSHTTTQVVFSAASDGCLKALRLDGTGLQTITPLPVKDFLVSEDLKLCLFRGTNGSLYFFRNDTRSTNLVWQTDERFFMEQVAFSPSGDHVAFVSKKGQYFECLNTKTGRRLRQSLPLDFDGASVAWSTEENKFLVTEKGGVLQVVIQPDEQLQVERLTGTNKPAVLPCYGRVGDSQWGGGGDWGRFYNMDTAGNLKVFAVPGLGSFLRITREGERKPVFVFGVNSGLLHFSVFQIRDVAFLDEGRECLFEASGHIYLLDVEKKKIGLLAPGDRYILLSPRYQKKL
jgi:hypothetical protein